MSAERQTRFHPQYRVRCAKCDRLVQHVARLEDDTLLIECHGQRLRARVSTEVLRGLENREALAFSTNTNPRIVEPDALPTPDDTI